MDLLSLKTGPEWGQHVSEISCKAAKKLGFLRPSLALAPRHTKEIAYKTFFVLSSSMHRLFGIPKMKLRHSVIHSEKNL